VIDMALPISKAKSEVRVEEPGDPVEDLLPKADLDFSQVPSQTPQAKGGKTTGRIQAPSLSKGRIIGLSAVLVVALVGGAWYGKWWQQLPAGKKTPTVAARPLPAKSAPKGPPSSAPVAQAQQAASANPAQTSGETANTAASDMKEDGGTVKAAETVASRAQSRPVESTKEKPSSRKEKPEENARPQAAPAVSAADALANDSPVTPPKLVKAANPVYPPDAMRSYITGDVKAEVAVDAKGHVTEVTVLSGPQALRAAAVDALKQYQYAPATQGSKAVDAKTTAVVKFWFNP
jgi:TonB family protein